MFESPIDIELAECAKINFQNLEDSFPILKRHPYFIIAKAQLAEALGEKDAIQKALVRTRLQSRYGKYMRKLDHSHDHLV